MGTLRMDKAYGPPLVLNETSSYVVGWSVPYLYDRHESEQSEKEEFTIGESIECDFRGLPAELEHEGARAMVGTIVGHRPGDAIETLIELPASGDKMAILAKNGLSFTRYSDFSLRHRWERDRSTGRITKTAMEVSLCEEGARPGSHISQFYPSKRLLHCFNLASLQAFTARYDYTPPPPIENRLEDLKFADVDNTPELAAYVRDVLWPEVHARRQTLLKEAGYIAGSRKHKTTTEPMSTAATNAASATAAPTQSAAANTASAVPTPTINIAATPSAILNPAASALTTTAPSLPPPMKADALGAAMIGTPALAIPAATVGAGAAAAAGSGSAMAEDTPLDAMTEQSRIDLWNRAQNKMDGLTAEVAAANKKVADMQAQLEAANRDKLQAELARRETEAKTQIDMLLDNHDGLSDEERRSTKEQYNKKLELYRGSNADQYKQLVGLEVAQLQGTIAASKRNAALMSQAQQRPTAYAPKQWASRTEFELARQIAGPATAHIINEKNFGRISNPPGSASIADEPAARDEQQAAKKAAIGNDEGVVSASARGHTVVAHNTGQTPEPQVTQDTKGWAGICFRMSLAEQAGQATIIVPSQEQMMRGGSVATETNVVRRHKRADGSTVSVPEIELRERFENEKPWDLNDYDPQIVQDIKAALYTGVFHRHGKPQQALPYDTASLTALAQNAVAAEQYMKQTGRIELPFGVV